MPSLIIDGEIWEPLQQGMLYENGPSHLRVIDGEIWGRTWPTGFRPEPVPKES